MTPKWKKSRREEIVTKWNKWREKEINREQMNEINKEYKNKNGAKLLKILKCF